MDLLAKTSDSIGGRRLNNRRHFIYAALSVLTFFSFLSDRQLTMLIWPDGFPWTVFVSRFFLLLCPSHDMMRV